MAGADPTDARGVPAGMTARWGAARRGPADDGSLCPARCGPADDGPLARTRVLGRASPEDGGACPRVPCPRVLKTAGRAGESRARESRTRRGVPGGCGPWWHAPGLLTRRCSGHRWRGSLGWAQFWCPAAPLTATLGCIRHSLRSTSRISTDRIQQCCKNLTTIADLPHRNGIFVTETHIVSLCYRDLFDPFRSRIMTYSQGIAFR